MTSTCECYIPPPATKNGDFVGGGSSGLVTFVPPDRVRKAAYGNGDMSVGDIANERQVFEALAIHPRILKYFGKWNNHDLTALFEYHPRGCLRQLLLFGQDEEKKQIPQLEWATQIVEAVAFVHSKGYVHTDLNASNLLVTKDNNLVLCDLACATPIGTASKVPCGSPHCFRPRPANVDPKLEYVRFMDDDLFALASVFYELYTHERVYADKEPHFEVGKLFDQGIFPDVSHIPVGKIIMECWKGEYETAEQVLADLRENPLPSLASLLSLHGS